VTAHFRFYEELNDFLPPARRKVAFAHAFKQRASVKDMIESLGVPHTEIDLILVNGVSVDFAYIVRAEDRISVYPMFESFDIAPLGRLRPKPLRDPRFILDTHLGKLARYIRLVGFDTLYDNASHDEALAETAAAEQRILLTRDIGLLKRKQVLRGYFVRATSPRIQLREIIDRFDLRTLAKPFTRCVRCNVGLLDVGRHDLQNEEVPAAVLERFERFRLCPGCDRVFWQGSHYERMQCYIEELLQKRAKDRPRERSSAGRRD
jgi:uncharacterized protein with PIN domain